MPVGEHLSVVYPAVGTRVGGSVVSTALLAAALLRHTSQEPIVVLPSGAANAAVFKSHGVGVEYYELPEKAISRIRSVGGVRGYLHALPGLLTAYRSAFSFLRSRMPDLVHVNDDQSMLPWGLAAKRVGLPVIWHVRQERSSPLLDRVRLQIADRLVFVADANRRRFDGLPIPPTAVRVHNWVDTEEFSPPAVREMWKVRLGFERRAPLIGFVGNLVARKRPEWAVEALGCLKQLEPRPQIAMIGEDFSSEREYSRRLETIASDLGVGQSVKLLGYRNDIADLMKAFDILVLPSVRDGEAFPRSVIEAMASGVAVVATDVAGVKEAVVDGVTGFLADPDDFHDFVSKLRRVVVENATRARMQEFAVMRANEAFSELQGVEAISSLYSSLMSSR